MTLVPQLGSMAVMRGMTTLGRGCDFSRMWLVEPDLNQAVGLGVRPWSLLVSSSYLNLFSKSK